LKFRTKLLITLVAVALLTNGISIAVMYKLLRHYLYDGYRAKLLSITASIATMLDGDALKTIHGHADEASPAYQQLRQQLRRVRDANRRKDTQMQRVFTVMRAPQDSKVLLVTVDSEESLENSARVGEVYRTGGAAIDIDQTVAEENFTSDEFGNWLRGHAPVRDSSGNVVVVEASTTWVESRMKPIALSALGSLLLAALIAVPGTFLLSRRVSRPLSELHGAVELVGQGKFDTRLGILSNDEFGAVARALNTMAQQLGERERMKTAFARYVSHQVMDSILASDKDMGLSGDRRRITVLFCDIRGFSSMPEQMPPGKVVQLLNEYFEQMVEVIFRNNGTPDKFIGDGIMVIFGAPEDDPYQEERALKTAIEMQRELRRLRKKWEGEGLSIRVGIGINSGPAIVGNIGSSRRMEYTAIGDTVNLASRLETATKDLGVGILISEYTYNAVRGSFPFRNTGSVHVRGRSETGQTYSVEELEGTSAPVEELVS